MRTLCSRCKQLVERPAEWPPHVAYSYCEKPECQAARLHYEANALWEWVGFDDDEKKRQLGLARRALSELKHDESFARRQAFVQRRIAGERALALWQEREGLALSGRVFVQRTSPAIALYAPSDFKVFREPSDVAILAATTVLSGAYLVGWADRALFYSHARREERYEREQMVVPREWLYGISTLRRASRGDT